MMCFKDKTFCGSENCKNKCNRKITDIELQQAKKMNMPIMYSDFCSEEKELAQIEE